MRVIRQERAQLVLGGHGVKKDWLEMAAEKAIGKGRVDRNLEEKVNKQTRAHEQKISS